MNPEWTEAELRAAIDEASIPVLLMVLVHLTGDRRWIEDPYLPARNPLVYAEEDGGFTPELQGEIREAASQALLDWRDGGRLALELPDEGTLVEMMSVCMGEDIPPEYAGLMYEEMGLRDRDIPWRRDDSERSFSVAVIGAGMSGLLTAIKLEQAGVDFAIYEKNATVGGTWLENRYPGCGVDTPNHFYSFSFEPNHAWSGYYSKQQELHDYFERIADDYDLRRRVRFSTTVDALAWNDRIRQWELQLTSDGSAETVRATVVVTAVGQLNRAKLPAIEGLDRFAGPMFHSAHWDHGVSLADKQVAVIGTGASAMQFVPTVASQAAHLHIFQRSPQWAVPNPNYHRTVADGKKWLLEHVPFYARWYRFRLFWKFGDGLIPSLQKDPDWELRDKSLNKINDGHRRFLTTYIEKQVGDRPELLAKVLPDYPPYGKRMLIDNEWFSTLTRDDVSLVTEPVDHIEEAAIVTADGRSHPADVVIFATGFESLRLLWPLSVTGRDGVTLAESWGDDDATAHLGITVPGFPNLFLMYGPNTNLGHGGSAIFHAECQVRYIMGLVQAMFEQDLDSVEVKAEVHDDYVARVDAAHQNMIWTHEGMDNWYRNRSGRVVSNSPWRLVDYWAMTHDPDLDEYLLEGRQVATSTGAAS